MFGINNFNTFEDELDYLIDKVENPANKKNWVDMVDDLQTNTHPDVLRKSFTGGRYGGYNVAKFYKAKIAEGCTSEEIERLEMLKDEIYKERCKISDLNRSRNAKLREESRFETLVEVLKCEMNNFEPLQLNEYKPKTAIKKITGILQLSDLHIGKIIDNQWNVYNYDVAKQRINIIADKTIEKSKLHSVTDLVVEINGDILEGLIQISSRNSEEADVISQITFASELLAQVINKLKPHYENIRIITTLGNHGRLFSDKKNGMTKENFEMLIPEFLKFRIGNDVSIIKSYGLDFTSYEIDDKLICVAHGQNDKISKVIADFSKIYKKVPYAIHLAHFHQYTDVNDCDIYTTVNGSLCGTDDYALTLRKITKPAQNFIIYGDDRCIYSLQSSAESPLL